MRRIILTIDNPSRQTTAAVLAVLHAAHSNEAREPIICAAEARNLIDREPGHRYAAEGFAAESVELNASAHLPTLHGHTHYAPHHREPGLVLLFTPEKCGSCGSWTLGVNSVLCAKDAAQSAGLVCWDGEAPPEGWTDFDDAGAEMDGCPNCPNDPTGPDTSHGGTY